MNNTDILQFIYDRLIYLHKENKNYDYMKKFKEIIDSENKIKLNETRKS